MKNKESYQDVAKRYRAQTGKTFIGKSKQLMLDEMAGIVYEQPKVEYKLTIEPIITSNKFQPSIYQQAVYYNMEHTTNNLLIEAVAGSGKTTTIVNAMKLISGNKLVTFCAFNKSIVEELKEKVPSFVTVSTMHALGMRALRAYYGNGIKINNNKIYNVCDKVLPHIAKEDRRSYYAIIKRLVDLMRQNMTFENKDVLEIANKYGIDIYNGEVDDAVKVLEGMILSNKEFDFTDMLFFPAFNDKIKFKPQDWVFVDECQDLNIAQQVLLRKMLRKDGRFVCVGDSRQAIYGFAGSDVESFNKLALMPNTVKLPLSICYRCDVDIVTLAKSIVPEIESRPNADKGIVRDGKVAEISLKDMILCRNTKPLVRLCLQFLTEGKKANVKGQDIGQNLIHLIKKTKAKQIIQLQLGIDHLIDQAKQKAAKDGWLNPAEAPSVVSIIEKSAVIDLLIEGCKTVDSVISKIENIFKDESDGIVLSTIHKAKGLENDKVFIICPELMPSKYAKADWEMEQERNLMYVAYTRAKHELVFITDFKG